MPIDGNHPPVGAQRPAAALIWARRAAGAAVAVALVAAVAAGGSDGGSPQVGNAVGTFVHCSELCGLTGASLPVAVTPAT